MTCPVISKLWAIFLFYLFIWSVWFTLVTDSDTFVSSPKLPHFSV